MSNDSNQTEDTPLKPLNWRQRAFADYLLLNPGNQAEAYRQAGYNSETPEREACELAKKPNVAEYLDRERSRLARIAGFTRESVACFLIRVMDTPIGEVDETSPLCQEFQRTRKVVGQGDEAEEWEIEKAKMPDKLGAADKLLKMMGWNEPEKMPVGMGDALTSLLTRVRKGRS